MDIKQLARTDLNLLVSLQVLLEESNVTKAAERLCISQSAMSKVLGRLREIFDDPLFTRSGHGLIPTPRAISLHKPLHIFLRDAEALISPVAFDPSTYHGELQLAISEMIGTAILPPLMETLQCEAPNLRINAITRVENQIDKLAAGEVDAAIHARYAAYDDEVIVDPLVKWPPILVVRKGHPLTLLPAPLQGEHLELIRAYPRVILCMQDIEWFGSRWGAEFKKNIASMKIAVETSNMISALEIVKRTDCVMYSSPSVCHYPPLGTDLEAVEIPYADWQVGEYVMAMHKRVETSAPHQWLRRKILDVAKAIEQK